MGERVAPWTLGHYEHLTSLPNLLFNSEHGAPWGMVVKRRLSA